MTDRIDIVGELSFSKERKPGKITMIDQNDIKCGPLLVGAWSFHEHNLDANKPELWQKSFLGTVTDKEPFTRSNGTIMARLYERLTKASRRRSKQEHPWGVQMGDRIEIAYRQGVYDAYSALQEELSE